MPVGATTQFAVAGLSAAHLLARKCDVSIFEREATVGMDAHSLDSHGAPCAQSLAVSCRLGSLTYKVRSCTHSTYLSRRLALGWPYSR